MQNRTYNTKAIVEGGILSAIIVVMMLISVYVPVFYIFGIFLLPIPVTILYLRHNFKVAVIAVIASGVIVAITYDPISALTAAFLYGLIGITSGYCIKTKKKFSTTIILLALSMIVVFAVNISVYTMFIDNSGIVGMITKLTNEIRQSFETAKGMYASMGVDTKQFAQINDIMNMLTPESFLHLLAGYLIIGSFMGAYLNYIIIVKILKKFKYQVQEALPFTRFYVPNIVGAILIGILCVGIILTTKKIPIGPYIQNSLMAIIQFAFTIDGIALMVYYLINKFHISKKIITVIIIFTIFTPTFSMLYVYAGLIDLVFDFRKLDPNRLFRR